MTSLLNSPFVHHTFFHGELLSSFLVALIKRSPQPQRHDLSLFFLFCLSEHLKHWAFEDLTLTLYLCF